MENGSASLPNPLTPMAFLPPDIARQMTIGYYICVAALVIIIWDVLNNMSADFRLLKLGISMPLAAYFLSRFAVLAFQLGVVILNTAPIGNCEEVARVRFLYPVQVGLTTLLFLFRVRAVYHNSRWVTAVFSFMWLGVIGASITEVFHSSANLGPTDYCIDGQLPRYTVVASIVPFVNDTLVFIAITWKLTETARGRSDTLQKQGYIGSVLFGNYLPNFSKAMLKEGQAYYLTTVVLYLFFLIMFYIKAVPESIRWYIGMPAMAVINILACRVYRNTKLGIYRESTSRRPVEMSGSLALSSRAIVLKQDEHIIVSRDIESNINDNWTMHGQEVEENFKGTHGM